MKTIFAAAVSAAFAMSSLPATAQTLETHSIAESPANGPAGVARPDRGLSMDSVRARFGNPSNVMGPVGKPPITQWVYGDYTVYFEHDRVIHSVVHRDLRAARQP